VVFISVNQILVHRTQASYSFIILLQQAKTICFASFQYVLLCIVFQSFQYVTNVVDPTQAVTAIPRSSQNNGKGQETSMRSLAGINSFNSKTIYYFSLGQGCFLAKTDTESVFRLIPLQPSDYELFGIYWEGSFCYDKPNFKYLHVKITASFHGN